MEGNPLHTAKESLLAEGEDRLDHGLCMEWEECCKVEDI